MSMFDTEIREVPVEDIHLNVNIKNIRTHFDRSKVEELANSIKRDGLMVPLVVMSAEDEEGNLITELVAGERRYRAIRLIQREDSDFMEEGVPCVTYAGTIHDAKYVNASENIDREDVDEVDISQWIFSRTEDGVTQTELAQRMNKSQGWVSQRVTFHDRAADEVKQALREALISFTTAYELSKNFSKEEQIKRIEKARRTNEKITVEEARKGDDPNKVKKPGKKARAVMLRRADGCATEVARGISFALRWVEGDISDEEMGEVIAFEESK